MSRAKCISLGRSQGLEEVLSDLRLGGRAIQDRNPSAAALGAGVSSGVEECTDEVDALLTEAYVAGVSHRKAGELTAALLGARVARSTVSRVVERLDGRWAVSLADMRRSLLRHLVRHG